MADFFVWLSSGFVSSTIFIIIVSIVGVSLPLIYLVAFFQGREISFYPPKIGERPNKTNKRSDGESQTKTQVNADDFFHTRESALTQPFTSMLEECEELWVVGKDCHGLLTTHFDQIQKAALNRKKIRFLIVDHSNKSLLNTMSASSITRPESKQRTDTAKESLKELRRLIAAAPEGDVKVRLANFLPTCTCTIFDGSKARGRMTVENYGYKISSGQRLRIYMTKEKSPKTFAFYIQQFEEMWEASVLLDSKSS